MLSRWHIIGFVFVLFMTQRVEAEPRCLAAKNAEKFLIYLHGLESIAQQSQEEQGNWRILGELSAELKLSIALPEGPLCKNKQRCWPGSDAKQILESFKQALAFADHCWQGQPNFSLVGFSNGGYFSFKLQKIHSEQRLKQVIAFGSAGYWNARVDRFSAFSHFYLIAGIKEKVFRDAQFLSQQLKLSKTPHTFISFQGGHRLDKQALLKILNDSK